MHISWLKDVSAPIWDNLKTKKYVYNHNIFIYISTIHTYIQAHYTHIYKHNWKMHEGGLRQRLENQSRECIEEYGEFQTNWTRIARMSDRLCKLLQKIRDCKHNPNEVLFWANSIHIEQDKWSMLLTVTASVFVILTLYAH